MMRVQTFKLYPNAAQVRTLERWIRACCWVYNHALAHRKLAYRRRKESVNYYRQQKMLTDYWRRSEDVHLVPVWFVRDALRRVDFGFKRFFARCKSGEKPGYPRFKSHKRYDSMAYNVSSVYADGRTIRVPNMGHIRSRGPAVAHGKQKVLRIIRKASGWYAQVVIDDGKSAPIAKPIKASVGIDVGLNVFAATSDGDMIVNPRWARRSESKKRALQRRVSRRKKGSNRRRKAVKSLRRHHERIADQRSSYIHQHTTDIARRYDLIAVEKLNVKGLARTRFSKSILDCGWSMFVNQLRYKAEEAGARLVEVDPMGTSQECPECGRVKPKKLSERTHECECGCVLDRDVAAARVIIARALVVAGAERPWRDSASAKPLVAAR